MGRLLVDGYNVIRRDPPMRELEERDPAAARTELLRLLEHHSLRRYQVVVVFDGLAPAGPPPRAGRVRIRFSHAETADALIARMCTSSDVVVTDDRGLAADTLQKGPAVWSVARLTEMVRPARRARHRQPDRAEPPPVRMQYPRLRRFDLCPRCIFAERDDWVMLCEEDSLLGRPRNFREEW